MREDLGTAAPLVEPTAPSQVTGNLTVSVPVIAEADASIERIGVISDRLVGLVEACGDDHEPFAAPVLSDLSVRGEPASLGWSREGGWIPRFEHAGDLGQLTGWILAPTDEHEKRAGLALRIQYHNDTTRPRHVRLGWSGSWHRTELTHFRAKHLPGQIGATDDSWTGSCVLSANDPSVPLAIGIRGGPTVVVRSDPHGEWAATSQLTVGVDETATVDVYLAVARESDGASVTALALRRHGFDSLHLSTTRWLQEHALPAPTAHAAQVLNGHLFFNYFFAQADCLDSGAPVILTSRSQRYYVSAAFWSRDAYIWTFPALLLADHARARRVLVETITRGGKNLANHALYIDGTELYPGFELDQAAAPLIALWRYVDATGDQGVLSEPAILSLLDGWLPAIDHWFNPRIGLYATWLMPTDDPTDFPHLLTNNALIAAAMQATAMLAESFPTGRSPLAQSAGEYRRWAAALHIAMQEHLTSDWQEEAMWAWACDASGHQELREEPPLSLRLLPYLGFCAFDDPRQIATLRWITTQYGYYYAGEFSGAGAPHFPFPSGFDLAARLLTEADDDGELLDYLLGVPMDNGLGCESWDPHSGQVRTGAAMASMSGYLAWCWWARMNNHRRWDSPLPGPDRRSTS